MDYTVVEDQGEECVLNVKGTFTFSDNNKFREILMLLKQDKTSSLVLDIHNLQFIDSAALGMLLLLQDEASKKHAKITLRGATGQIKKMLELSNFDELFTIKYAS